MKRNNNQIYHVFNRNSSHRDLQVHFVKRFSFANIKQLLFLKQVIHRMPTLFNHFNINLTLDQMKLQNQLLLYPFSASHEF